MAHASCASVLDILTAHHPLEAHLYAPFTQQGAEAEFGCVCGIATIWVVIIIGILAAIAIPVFLNQRESAREAAAQSDLRNGASAATTCAADKGGSYATCTEEALVSNYDWNQTDGVASNVTTNSATEWVATSKHNDDDTTYTLSTNDGRVKEQAAAK